MPTINNIEFLTLPQQVMKNKRDVVALQTEIADTAVSVAGEFSNVYIGLNALSDRVDDTEETIQELLLATEDTGWLPISDVASNINPHMTAYIAIFIRKVGNVVNIVGQFEADEIGLGEEEEWFSLPVGYRCKRQIKLPAYFDNDLYFIDFYNSGEVFASGGVPRWSSVLFNITYLTE